MLICFLFLALLNSSGSSTAKDIVARLVERNIYMLAPVNQPPPGYRPLQDMAEAKRAAEYLGIPFWKNPPSHRNLDDPYGAVYRAPEERIYWNLAHGSRPSGNWYNRKLVYKKIQVAQDLIWKPTSGRDIPALLRDTGLLFHAFGVQQGLKQHPYRYPEEVLEHWQYKSDGLYQQSATFVMGNIAMENVVSSPVGILIDPSNPKVTVHLMGRKEMYYSAAVRKFPIESPKQDMICSQRQGLLEASRAQFNAYNWRVVTHINGCYLAPIIENSEQEAGMIRKADGVKFFLGSPLRALKDNFMQNQLYQISNDYEKRSRKNVECVNCLWNEAIISAPVDAILGAIMWVANSDAPVSRFGVNEPTNNAGFWFSHACVAVKRINPSTKCYRVDITGKIIQSPDGSSPHSGLDEESRKKAFEHFPKGIAGQTPEILEVGTI